MPNRSLDRSPACGRPFTSPSHQILPVQRGLSSHRGSLREPQACTPLLYDSPAPSGCGATCPARPQAPGVRPRSDTCGMTQAPRGLLQVREFSATKKPRGVSQPRAAVQNICSQAGISSDQPRGAGTGSSASRASTTAGSSESHARREQAESRQAGTAVSRTPGGASSLPWKNSPLTAFNTRPLCHHGTECQQSPPGQCLCTRGERSGRCAGNPRKPGGRHQVRKNRVSPAPPKVPSTCGVSPFQIVRSAIWVLSWEWSG